MKKPKKVTAIIVNYNTRDLLQRCINALIEYGKQESVRIAVVDNGSVDKSWEMVKSAYPDVHLVRFEENKGIPVSINAVVHGMESDFFFLLHPDVEIRGETIKGILRVFDNFPDAGIVGGDLYYPDGQPNPCEVAFPKATTEFVRFGVCALRSMPFLKKTTHRYSPLYWKHDRTRSVNWVWNACMMIKGEVVKDIGGFDERFHVWFSDWDFCWRAKSNGWRSYYAKGAHAVHYERHSPVTVGAGGERVRYKKEGLYSRAKMYIDRFVFLRKHATSFSVSGLKVVYFVEDGLRLAFVLAEAALCQRKRRERDFKVQSYLASLHAILAG